MIPGAFGAVLEETEITAVRASTATLQVLAPHQHTDRHHQNDEDKDREGDEEEKHDKVSRGVREGRKVGGFDRPKVCPVPNDQNSGKPCFLGESPPLDGAKNNKRGGPSVGPHAGGVQHTHRDERMLNRLTLARIDFVRVTPPLDDEEISVITRGGERPILER
jgi:hypothetical protein